MTTVRLRQQLLLLLLSRSSSRRQRHQAVSSSSGAPRRRRPPQGSSSSRQRRATAVATAPASARWPLCCPRRCSLRLVPAPCPPATWSRRCRQAHCLPTPACGCPNSWPLSSWLFLPPACVPLSSLRLAPEAPPLGTQSVHQCLMPCFRPHCPPNRRPHRLPCFPACYLSGPTLTARLPALPAPPAGGRKEAEEVCGEENAGWEAYPRQQHVPVPGGWGWVAGWTGGQWVGLCGGLPACCAGQSSPLLQRCSPLCHPSPINTMTPTAPPCPLPPACRRAASSS